jgi:hypothetical protein
MEASLFGMVVDSEEPSKRTSRSWKRSGSPWVFGSGLHAENAMLTKSAGMRIAKSGFRSMIKIRE